MRITSDVSCSMNQPRKEATAPKSLPLLTAQKNGPSEVWVPQVFVIGHIMSALAWLNRSILVTLAKLGSSESN